MTPREIGFAFNCKSHVKKLFAEMMKTQSVSLNGNMYSEGKHFNKKDEFIDSIKCTRTPKNDTDRYITFDLTYMARCWSSPWDWHWGIRILKIKVYTYDDGGQRVRIGSWSDELTNAKLDNYIKHYLLTQDFLVKNNTAISI